MAGLVLDTPAKHIYTGDGTTRVYPIPTYIQGDDWIRIEIDGVYIVDRRSYDIVNNNIIFVTAPGLNTQVSVQVATSVEALSQLGNSTNVDTVAGSISNVNTVATNINNVNTVANNTTNVNTTATNINNVNIVANDINSVKTTATNINNVNTTAGSISNVNTVAGNISKVNTVATNIVDINQIVDNLPEILLADDNATTATQQATIATTKASEASASANQALTSRNQAETFKNSASTSATTATTKASEASASATSASTSANQALTSRNQAETFAQQAQASALSVDANNIVHRVGDESIAGVKTFTSSPIVPTPINNSDAVNKQYVDNGAGVAFVSDDARVKTALNATGTAPIYACRAWVNFNGTGTVAIRKGENVSSVTDNGVGMYTVNFTTAMPDANYALNCTAGDTMGRFSSLQDGSTPSTTSVKVQTYITSGYTDAIYVYASIFR